MELSKLKLLKPAALIIDMQPNFLTEIASAAKELIIPAQIEVLKVCKKEDWPVVCVEFEGGKPTIPKLSEFYNLIPRTQRIEKSNVDAFDQTSLDKILQEWGVNHLIAMGVFANGCVYATVETALSFNKYQVATASDLIADPNSQSGYYCLRKLCLFYESNKDLIAVVKKSCDVKVSV